MGSSDEKGKEGVLKSILIAVLVALLAGGTGPWYWKYIVRWWDGMFSDRSHPSYITAVSMSKLEVGINRRWADIPGLHAHADTAEQCSQRCLDNDTCLAMSFDTHENICWLKNGVPNPDKNPEMISAVKIFPKKQ